MKRILVLSMIAALAAMAAFADESVLIDFTNLVPDIMPDENGTPQQNKQTVMDFGVTAGGSYSDAQKALMKTSLAIPQWEVNLAKSSRTVENVGNSYTKVARSKSLQQDVMGVRIHFPVADYNSWAEIVPPFDIPAYNYDQVADDGTISAPAEAPEFSTPGNSRFEKDSEGRSGYGVVKNVGAIKGFAVEVYGLNFPCTLYLRYKDGSGRETEINMGNLQFDGWAQLTWTNPQYIQDVRNRAIRLYPLYPTYAPYIRFSGFRIARDAADSSLVGGDFIAYFKEVRVIYDKANLTMTPDIDNEVTWNIINEREQARQKIETKDFGKNEVLRYIEKDKQTQRSTFGSVGSPDVIENGRSAANAGGAAAGGGAAPANLPEQ